MLNWSTDPIYFDSEPQETNKWLNANELIEQNKEETIFCNYDRKLLKLYSIMVRRVDFVRKKTSDRILARFPYIELTDDEKEHIEKKQLSIAERIRDYFYKSDIRRTLEWRSILRKNLERGFIPLPFLRCLPDELAVDFKRRNFESARGEGFRMPIKLTPQIAYLCGLINGDGSLKKYVLSIVDFSDLNIQQLQNQFQVLFYQKGRIQHQTENSPEVIITNLWVVRFFSFLTSQPIGGKKYAELREPLLFKEEPFRSHYWSGAMDADGSYKNGTLHFVSASKRFTLDFIDFLNSHIISPNYNERGDRNHCIYIPKKYHQIYKDVMVSFHPEKKKEFQLLKEGRDHSSPIPKKFVGIKQSSLVNGYFNFSLLKNIQVLGLGSFITTARNSLTKSSFARKLGISRRFLDQLENNRNAFSISILERILAMQDLSLMPFLASYGRSIRFRKLSSTPIFLEYRPCDHFISLAEKLLFYNTTITLPRDDPTFKQELEEFFGIAIPTNSISNRLVLHFFETFCKLEVK